MSKGGSFEKCLPISTLESTIKAFVGKITKNKKIKAKNGCFEFSNLFMKSVYKSTITGLGSQEADCEVDATTGDLLLYTDPNQESSSKEIKLDESEVIKITSEIINIPKDAVLEGVYDPEITTGNTTYEIRWDHFEDIGDKRVKIVGDYISVMINPESKRFFSFAKKWTISSI